MSTWRHNAEIQKLSDIEVSHVWKVYCPGHGYIDETDKRADALEARREHFRTLHGDDSAVAA